MLGTRALLVSGGGSLRRAGRLAEVVDSLRSSGVFVCAFDGVPAEPALSLVDRGISVVAENHCDVVIAIGGGSAMDVGKAVAGLAQASGSTSEYFDGRVVEKKGLPFIAIPTTSGSGAEVTPNAVLTDEGRGVKASIRSWHLLADVAIVDPELTLSCSPETTAFSGMDALCQALEALVSKGATPLTNSLSRDAAVGLLRHLPGAYAHGDDLGARTEVALGSLMGAMAFSNSRLGLVHGLAHPLGVLTGLPHGLICGLFLPPVMRFNAHTSAGAYAEVARQAGMTSANDSDDHAAAMLIRRIERLNSDMGLNPYRERIAVPTSALRSFVEQTLASGSTKSNPRVVAEPDILQILDTV